MPKRSSLTMDDIVNDPTARIVTPAEAERLEARNREIDAQKRAARDSRRTAAAARSAVVKARLAPWRTAILALAPGQSCDIPAKEFPLVYRLNTETGRDFEAHKKPGGLLRVRRPHLKGVGAAEGLL